MKYVIPLVSAAFMLLAPQAHADDQTYLGELDAHGVAVPFGQREELAIGHGACDLWLRAGKGRPPVEEFIPIERPFAPVIIDAAQHQLCPDTLR